MNTVSIIGNLGQDPEMKFTQGGTALLKLSVAVNERWKDKSGEKQERTHWVRCTVWGNRAEALNKILSKGDKVGIEGSLEENRWEDQQGNKRTQLQVKVRDVTLLGSPSRQGGGGGPAPSSGPEDDGYADGFGDDIPFAHCAEVRRDRDPAGGVLR